MALMGRMGLSKCIIPGIAVTGQTVWVCATVSIWMARVSMQSIALWGIQGVTGITLVTLDIRQFPLASAC